jgi:hypothetical protein
VSIGALAKSRLAFFILYKKSKASALKRALNFGLVGNPAPLGGWAARQLAYGCQLLLLFNKSRQSLLPTGGATNQLKI